ncbi:hypothetical protein PVW46_16470 [Mameliella sp. AT18]|uniref:hypothetical protein n=1 Tax=Mameliella sp. AT18 TaxID=3028385 RepID=UPI00084101BF|nr:hypothetical protein [Mameliella sp. AT18]MDD9731498.1 hypothetical protein [Mameliella sp. AT18]ODM47917.1 hypothetical protein A9320_20995 [Ruegeria sp. PBVC088]
MPDHDFLAVERSWDSTLDPQAFADWAWANGVVPHVAENSDYATPAVMPPPGTVGPDLPTGGNGSNGLDGLGGNDTILAGGGGDTLCGRAGDDMLVGQVGADEFLYAIGWDADTVAGFKDDVGEVRLLNMGFATPAEALAFADQVDAQVIFDFGAGDRLSVLNITIEQWENDLLV